MVSQSSKPHLPDAPVDEVYADVACTVCGCVCDDLKISVAAGRIVRAEGACWLAEPWFLEQGDRRPPEASIAGRPAPLAEALDCAADILRASLAPLIYGLSRSSTPGQRMACRLADRLGGTIDTTASLCHGPSILAVQSVGESTCSLGEISNRADLVLYWGADPLVTHPRHMERYATEPHGMFTPGGRADRTLVVVHEGNNQTGAQADIAIGLQPGESFEALWGLRGLVAGVPVCQENAPGLPWPALADLAARMRTCRCGVVFFGLELSRGSLGHLAVEGLLRLVTELNAYTRFHARRLRIYGDVAGADSVLCWQTGFPFSVNLARGYPRYSPGEYSADELLARGEADACLLVGSEGLTSFSPAARAELARLPTIALEHAAAVPQIEPTVRFITDVYGIHRRGTAYRMDEVPIPLRAVLPPIYPADHEVLEQILARLGA